MVEIKKGSLVCVVWEKLENSLEVKVSDNRFFFYIFESKGEVVDIRGDYVFIKFGKVLILNIWLWLD